MSGLLNQVKVRQGSLRRHTCPPGGGSGHGARDGAGYGPLSPVKVQATGLEDLVPKLAAAVAEVN